MIPGCIKREKHLENWMIEKILTYWVELLRESILLPFSLGV